MNSKKLASIVVLIAGAFLLALVMESFGDKVYQRNYYKPAPGEETRNVDDIQEDLYQAQASAQWETIQLATLRGQPSPERIAVARERVTTTQTSLKKAQNDAYLSSKDAVQKTETNLTNQEIQAKHQEMLNIIVTWGNQINSGNPPSAEATNNYLIELQKHLQELQEIVDNLTPGNSGFTQEQIDEYKEKVESAVAEVNNAITNLTEAQSNAQAAQEELHNQESVGNPAAIQEQQAKVEEAEHKVEELQQELHDAQEQAAHQDPTYEDLPSVFIPGGDEYGPGVKHVPPLDPSKPHLIQD